MPLSPPAADPPRHDVADADDAPPVDDTTDRYRVVLDDDEPTAMAPPADAPPARPGPAGGPGTIACPRHGRRKPWVVCEHLLAMDPASPRADYRVYRIAWLYDGVVGASVEYRLCYECANACGLTHVTVDVERASELVEERVGGLCSSCGHDLPHPSQRPLVLERRA